MRLLVSGATTTIARLLMHPTYAVLARAHLGHLVTPASGNRLETLLASGLPIAVDNGAFAAHQAGLPFDWRGYQTFVARLAALWHADARLRERLQFVVAPDAVGDWRRTGAMWRTWQYAMPRTADALPWAFVAQDGQTLARLPMQGDPRAGRWVGCAALFVGGSTSWKLGLEAAALARAARRAGRRVHVGRVNSFERLSRFDPLGVDSCDGGQFSMFPATYIPRWLERISHRQRGLWEEAA